MIRRQESSTGVEEKRKVEGRGGREGAERQTGTRPSSLFRLPEPSSLAQVMDTGIIVWGVIRADGGIPPWGSVKE